MIITTSNFEEKVLKYEKPVIVDFWATWCGPCQMQGPIIEELASETTDFEVGKLNVDEEMALAQKYRVAAIPTLLVFKGGECVETLVGFHSKEQILEVMQKYK